MLRYAQQGVNRGGLGLWMGCLGWLIWAGAASGQGPDQPPGRRAGGEATGHRDTSPRLWRPVGQMAHQPLAECSGIVASRQYPGIFWVHNDSGHPPVLYAIRESGRLVAEIPVQGATNSDWEDIAIDDRGHLYVGDIGNNYGMFPVRSAYQIAEPDPYATPVRPARVLRRYKFSYPAERFNAEALFVRSGEVFIVSRQPSSQTRIMRLEAQPGKTTPLVEVGSLAVGAVAGADVSADGERLAVCTSTALTVFALDAQGRPRTDVPPAVVRYPSDSIEACCFDGEDVVLAAERRSIYRVSAADLAAGTRFRARPAPKQRRPKP